MAGFGFILLIVAFFGFITGIIMVFFSKIRKYGLKTILASLVILIIGISICSISPSPFGNGNQFNEEQICNDNLIDWEKKLKNESKSLKKEFYSELKAMKKNDSLQNENYFQDVDLNDKSMLMFFSKMIENSFESRDLSLINNMPSIHFNKIKKEKWSNEVIASIKIMKDVYYTQNVISSTDSSFVYYSGFLDLKQSKFYLDNYVFSKTYIPFNESDYECVFSNEDKNYLNMKTLNTRERKTYFTLKMKDHITFSKYSENVNGLKVRIIQNNKEFPIYAFIDNSSNKFDLKPALDLK